MINGDSNEAPQDSECGEKSADLNANRFKRNKNDSDKGVLKNSEAEKCEETDDYSYYGTIKPVAENAGFSVRKNSDSEREKNENSERANEKIAENLKSEQAKIQAEKVNYLQQENAVKSALNLAKPQAVLHVNSIKNTVTRVYDEVFKNNPAFKSSLESIIKNLEEYVQALLLSVMLQCEITYEWFPEFVYEILPDGDIFGGAANELSVKIKIAEALKKQPTAMLMLAAVDVSFNKSETKQLINEIYGLYCACICALNKKPLAKEEILFNLISFAKNQGVNI